VPPLRPLLAVFAGAAAAMLATVPAYADVFYSAAPQAMRFTGAATPSITRPGYLKATVDPLALTRVTRVSDPRAMGVNLSTRGRIANSYPKRAAWNSDGSRLLLGFTSPAPLLDGQTYRYLRMVTLPTDPVWSNTEPNVIYGTDYTGSKFVSLNVETGRTTVVRSFPGYWRLTMGDGEGNLSDDDQYATLHGVRLDGTHDLILLDLWRDRTVVRNMGTSVFDWSGMSHSGDYVIVAWKANGYEDTQGVVVYNHNLRYVRSVDYIANHGDVAYDTTGNEVWVAGNDCHLYSPEPCDSTSEYGAFPLDGSQSYSLIDTATGYTARGEHTSGRALERPGWVFVSDYGLPASPSARYPGRDQTFALKLDPDGDPRNPVVESFGFAHHRPNKTYGTEPFSVPDPTGRKVVFGSEWGTGPTLAYVSARQAQK
jgi:hypothetical protein